MRRLTFAMVCALGGGCGTKSASPPPPEDAQTTDAVVDATDASDAVEVADDTSLEELRAHLEADVDAYLRADDPGPTPALLAKLDAEYKDVPFDWFEKAVRRHAPRALKAGISELDWTDAMLSSGKLRYSVYVPAKIAGTAVEKVPLLVFLHGAGGDGVSIVTTDLFKAAADAQSAILVAPSAEPTLCDWSGNEGCMSQVVLLVQLVKRKFPVDDDRVVLSGFSMGGRGSFSTVAAYPSAYAGVVPVAASIGAISGSSDPTVHKTYCCPHAENFGNVRLHYISGGMDVPQLLYQNRACAECFKEQGAEFVYQEIASIGHEIPPTEWSDAITWAFGKPRVRYPARVTFDLAPQLSSKYPGGVTFHQKLAVSEYWAFIDARIDATKPARISAKQTGNDVELVTDNVARVVIYFASEAFDLKQKVRVSLAGKVLMDELLTPDARLLLTEARARSERSMTFAAKRVLDVP